MKYSLYIIIFLAIASAIWMGTAFLRRLKEDLLFKILARRLLSKQKPAENGWFFSSIGLSEIVRRLAQNNHQALNLLTNGKMAKACLSLKKKKLAYPYGILLTIYNPRKAKKIWQQLCFKHPKNNLYRAELAKIYLINGKESEAFTTAESIKEKSASRYARGVKYYIQSIEMTKASEMKEASQNASAAVKCFEKERCLAEAGIAYLQLGTIYRVSAVSDVAQTMFESALGLFKKLQLAELQAEALGNLGMLTAAQNRFEEAESYFEKALNLNKSANRKRGEAEILNQQALLSLAQKQNSKARKTAEKALKIHQQLHNLQGQAFSWDILSYINLSQKKYDELIFSAQKALSLYNPNQNLSAILEMKYMQASAYFVLGKNESAEKILRQITKQAAKQESCFHVANAYNLLGLIFLQKKEFQRAKGLFMQAVSFEERNERFNCAAVDYANIALIEQKCGNVDQARKTLELALEYAQNFEADELVEQLKKQLQQLG